MNAATDSATMTTVDLVVHARWIIPIVPASQVLEHASLVVDAGGIVAVLPQREARQRYQARRTLQLDDHVLLPGLINAHGHAAMTLLRGFADDHPLETWLNEHIWPAERQWVAADFVRDGTELAMAEMIRSGTTCFSDMYFFPEQIVQAAAGAGMRCQAAFPVMDFPTAWGDGPQTYLGKGLALAEQYRGDARIRIAFGPHAPYTVSPMWLERIVALSQEHAMPIQIHLHETASEVQTSLREHGKRPMQRMMDLGVLGPATQCVHMTQLDDGDIALLRQTGAHVVHCPESNLKLVSGFCPVGQLLQVGVNVALGTDGAASNNNLDLFGEMKAAALLAKAVAGDAAAMDAHAALRMATLNGARALGIDALVGSLEADKRADFIAVSLADLAQQPVYRPASQLVYTAVGHCVTHVWVDGQCLLDERILQTIDEEMVKSRTRQWRQRIMAA